MKSFAGVVLMSLSLAPLVSADEGPVRIGGGLIAGAPGKSSELRVYKGIPYAAPPVGALRWKAPQAAAHWEGVRPAAEFSAACMQQPYPQASIYYQPPRPVSEDCLYLNVWTAAKQNTEKRPVMVWIHGGGFTRGSGDTPTYDGENLAKKGVIVVTINYRLGVFGFFAHPELTKESDVRASGNYGLLDMVSALEWVQKNIAAFGGDPKRVTIFGESAGSWAVNYLMATPLAKGLFQGVIGESGANFARSVTLAAMEKEGESFAAKIGAASLADLRAKPAQDLLQAPGAFRPVVDGWFMPKDVSTIFAEHKQNDVPLIAGSNADEMRTLAPFPANGTSKSFQEMSQNHYGKSTDEFLKIYPSGTNEQAAQAHYDSFRDETFGWQMRTWARKQTQSGKAPAYLYYFTRQPPGPNRDKYRAYHAAEIQYVFGNLAPAHPWEDADRQLSEMMSSYWVNFATTGNPNGKGLPKWPVYDAASDPAMEFGDRVAVTHEVNKPALDFFDRFLAASK